MLRVVFLILISLTLFSCNSDDDLITPNVNYNYAGLEVGKFVVYDVVSILYNDFTGTIDTSVFQIRELVDSKFTDLEGDEAYRIHRFQRSSDTLDWTLTDAWSSKLTATTYEKVEENVRFLKMIFPVVENDTWNGNSINNLEQQDYEYISVHISEEIGGNNLDSVATILQFENINLIQEEYFEEKFATGIGLVYKKSLSVENEFNSSTGLFERNSGTDITMTLNSYGKL